MNIKELKEKLDEANIPYKARARKAELESLIDTIEENVEAIDDVVDAIEEKLEAKLGRNIPEGVVILLVVVALIGWYAL